MSFKMILVVALAFLLSSTVEAASHRKMVFVNTYDLDGDWELQSEEFDHARLKRFNNTDENQDNLVNEDEYVFEYQNKLDKQLSKDRKGQVQQTKVRFKALDKNENSQMEWQEYEASGLRSFTRYDVNKDGVIDDKDSNPTNNWERKKTSEMTKQERDKQREQQLASAKRKLKMPTTHNKEGMLIKYDGNQDGAITLAEHTARRRADFDLTDENNNGWVSADEYLFEYQNRLDKQIVKTRKARIRQASVRFKSLDTDGSKQMTFAEYQVSGHRTFNRWNTDQDSVVTMTEAMPEPRKKYDMAANQVVAVNE